MNILGIDIGGTGIKGAIVNADNGKLITERYRLPTPKPSLPSEVSKVVHQIIEHFNYQGPVGVTFPSIIKKGKCYTANNVHNEWIGTQIDELFEKHCDRTFFVLNDADAAAEAEMKYGAGVNEKGLVLTITVGTGIGSGAFYNGELIPNIELGSLLGEKGQKVESYIADSARKREELSFKKWAKRFDFLLNHIVDVLNPDLFIIGGGVSKKIEKFEKLLTIDVPIVAAKNQNNAGIIGAAMFALDQIEK